MCNSLISLWVCASVCVTTALVSSLGNAFEFHWQPIKHSHDDPSVSLHQQACHQMRLWSTHWTNTNTHMHTDTKRIVGKTSWGKSGKALLSGDLNHINPVVLIFRHVTTLITKKDPTFTTSVWCLRKIPQSFGTNMKSCLLLPPRHTRPPLFKPLWSRCLQHPHRSQGYTYMETPSGSVLQLCICMYMCVWRSCNTWAQICNAYFWMYVYLYWVICINKPLYITYTRVCDTLMCMWYTHVCMLFT